MEDKGVAGLVTFLAITPLVALCCLGPAVLSAGVAWLAGWFGGMNGLVTAVLAAATGAAVYWLVRRSRRRAKQENNTPADISRPSVAASIDEERS